MNVPLDGAGLEKEEQVLDEIRDDEAQQEDVEGHGLINQLGVNSPGINCSDDDEGDDVEAHGLINQSGINQSGIN